MFRQTCLLINTLQPACIGHVNLQDDVEIAFMIRGLVYRHALSSQYDAVAMVDNLARWTCDMNATTIQVCKEDPGESQQCFGERDMYCREQVVP